MSTDARSRHGLAAAACVVALLGLAAPSRARTGAESGDPVRVAGGDYRPFFKGKPGARAIPVAPFLLDRSPVTQREFAVFLALHPEWRRDRVKRLFAEAGYLAGWSGGQGPIATADQPVTNVSWFAATAYCECQGGRLPSQVEWEWALADADRATDPTRSAADQRVEPAVGRPLSVRFASHTEGAAELALAGIWEWTSDFNTLVVGNGTASASPTSSFCGDGIRATDARDYRGFLRFSFRSSLKADYALRSLGFRCARDLP